MVIFQCLVLLLFVNNGKNILETELSAKLEKMKTRSKIIYLDKYKYVVQYIKQDYFMTIRSSYCYRVVDMEKKTVQ